MSTLPTTNDFAIRTRRDRRRQSWCVWIVGALASLSGCGVATYQTNSSGVQLFEQGNYDGAARQFQRAVSTDPGFADGYYNLAATHHRLWKVRGTRDDATQAEQLYRLALDKNHEHREAYRGLSVLMGEQGRSQEAFTLVSDWAARSTKPAEARIELARLYAEYSDYNQAQARLREAIEIDPRNAQAFSELAALQERLGDPTQALTNYMRSYDIDRSQPAIEQRIASLKQSGGIGIFTPSATGTRMASTPPPIARY